MSKQLLKLTDDAQRALLGLPLGRTNAPALTLVEKGPLPPIVAPGLAPR
ncbi:MAG: hypothetical protein KKA05_07280 [Alphaproteobacteria bacterium]|nr:hypothetical protein [Alphaproteobacteria bacterium]